MEIKLKGREIPRNENGDAKFECLGPLYIPKDYPEGTTCPNCGTREHQTRTVINQFSPAEVVELVNRAIYQLEYQAAAHRKRGQAERDRMKKLKEELKKAGKDVKATLVERELKGE